MVHDERGNLTSVIETDGSAMKLTYDHLDRVVRVDGKSGDVLRYRYYDVNDELVERVDPDGLSVAWTWDDQGRLVGQTSRGGALTRYEYVDEFSTPVR
jgi:YD repeat-containing protein